MQPVFKVDYLDFINYFGAGVTLFFMLSCFSLLHSTIPKLEQNNWLKSYVYRRFFRIYPLFLFMLFTHLVLHYFLYGKIYSPGEIFLNLLLLYQFIPGEHSSIVWAGWTIGGEISFYCIFPLILAASHKLGLWLILLSVSTLLSIYIPGITEKYNLATSYAYMAFPRQLFVFIAGGVLYLLASKFKHMWYTKIIVWIFLLLAIVFRDYLGLVSTVIILGVLIYTSYRSSIFFNRFTRFLGEASYTIYLLHPIVIAILKPYLVKLYSLEIAVDLAFLVAFIVVYSVVIFLAYFINKYFELPMYQFGLKLQNNSV